VLEPVADQECVVFIKIAVIEDKKELASVGAKTLN
jgi:hypothetical protein